jgi:transposase, IS5 family
MIRISLTGKFRTQTLVPTQQLDLFRSALANTVNPSHPLVGIAQVADQNKLDEASGKSFCPANDRPAIRYRLMIALHYLKYTLNLSDKEVETGWTENPYWQYLSGTKYFEHDKN